MFYLINYLRKNDFRLKLLLIQTEKHKKAALYDTKIGFGEYRLNF